MAQNERMGDSRVIKRTFTDWLEAAVSRSTAVLESAHVDELDGVSLIEVDGLELVQRCCALLEKGRASLRSMESAHRLHYLAMFLPIPLTRTLSVWEESLWAEVSSSDEPPTVYAIARDQLLEEWDEEYRRPVQIPLAEFPEVRALYRCWRTQRDMENGWEFARGIYVVVGVAQLAVPRD